VEEVPLEKVSRYGVVDGKEVERSVFLIKDLIEKPEVSEAPSNLAIGGRYILTPEIFDYIDRTQPGKGGEIQLTDAIRLMCQREAVYAYKFEGKRHDIGNRLDYLKAIVDFSLKREDVGKDFKEYIKQKAAEV
jgi:UTP--glucose-1-phosphate uridylyltransferase